MNEVKVVKEAPFVSLTSMLVLILGDDSNFYLKISNSCRFFGPLSEDDIEAFDRLCALTEYKNPNDNWVSAESDNGE